MLWQIRGGVTNSLMIMMGAMYMHCKGNLQELCCFYPQTLSSAWEQALRQRGTGVLPWQPPLQSALVGLR